MTSHFYPDLERLNGRKNIDFTTSALGGREPDRDKEIVRLEGERKTER